jgi:hypothetical protein
VKKLMLLAAAAVLAGPAWPASAQVLTYATGQNISPAFEGWEKNTDGSFNIVFGYENRNWEEELDIPIGPENNIEPGGPDKGQPTHFLPRRNRFTFKVRVPADFGDQELVWTLTAHGVTEKAFGSLRPDYFVDNVVFMSERGALGAGTSTPEIRANKPPLLEVEGGQMRNVKAGEPIALIAEVHDDGVFQSRRGRAAALAGGDGDARKYPALNPPFQVTVGSEVGLRMSWFVYRGAGNVTFDPPQIEVWEDTRTSANSPWAPRWVTPKMPDDGRILVHATFDRPGTYVLRCRADDGGLWTDQDVTITVVP